MRTNYVLIDFENVQPTKFSPLEVDHFKVKIFIGASQDKLSYEVASAIQRLGTQAEYIKISGNGPNALDFHIAFYIGHIASTEPEAYFHIISKDTGFDPLIQHLKARKILVSRAEQIDEISILKVANAKTLDARVPLVVERLRKMDSGKPKTINSLTNMVDSHFAKKLTEAEVQAIISSLSTKRFITVNDSKVAYSLPKSL